MRVYVADLGKYNEGDLVGDWVELPVDDVDETLREIIYYDPQERDHALHDWEDIPFPINEYMSLHQVNEMAEAVANFSKEELEVLEVICDDGIADFEGAVEMVKNSEYRIYWDCKDMSDVARIIIEEQGVLKCLPESYQGYFDYESYGDTLQHSNTWRKVENLEASYYIEIFR